jgi:hypothetical protein
MNERIKELALQVGAVQNVLAMGRHDGVLFTETDLEKFAELIVRECMDNLEWHGHDEAVSQLNWFLHNKIRS